jgi:hypothetical protein
MSKETRETTCNYDPRLGLRPCQNEPVTSWNPDAIVNNGSLSDADTRELLASLTSDNSAVTNRPVLRRGQDGNTFRIADILHALKSLDRMETPVRDSRHQIVYSDWMRTCRRRAPWDNWLNNRTRRHRPDDDDDPPPCPASAYPVGPVPIDGKAGALAAA